jgi:hypothetical protein
VPERSTLAVRRMVAEHVADVSFDRALRNLSTNLRQTTKKFRHEVGV